MCCEHCVRGEAQNQDISDDVLDYVARYLQPSEVTFIGGEPSLNVPAIERYFELAEKYGHLPSAFYVVTNGKEHQEELAIALLKAYPKMDEQNMCGVSLSRDIFHDKYVPESTILNGLAFNRHDHKHPLTENDPDWVINTGRAKQTGVGRRPGYTIESDLRNIVEIAYGDVFIPDYLYVGVNGLVANQCDISYEELDSNAICSIKDLPALLSDIVKEAS